MLSFGKILLIVAVIVVVMIGFSVAKRLRPPEQPRPTDRQPDAARAAGAAKAADLKACPLCGTYSEVACARPDCPLPR